ncbi:MAG: aminotransferase class IV [Nitrospirota bacterium]
MINGKLVSKKDAKIPVWSSFGRGYGIFETLRTYGDKKIFQTKEHIDRLFDSAKKIDLSLKYNKTQINHMLEIITKKSPHKSQIIKIMAIEDYLILISNPLKLDKKIYDGVKCMSTTCTRSLPEVKSISYIASYLSHERAKKKGYFDAILTDKNGEVYEGAYSNLFWFEGHTLCTRKDEVLPGITRETIFKISPFKIKFKKIKLSQLIKKKEIFLTTSVKGIVPIIQIDKTKIGNGKPAQNTELLMKHFHEYASSCVL